MLDCIKSWPEQDRPREKLIAKGPSWLTDTELLSVILCTGHARSGRNALELARDVLQRFGSIAELEQAGMAELTSILGVGRAKAVQLRAAMELGRRLNDSHQGDRLSIKSSSDIHKAYRDRLRSLRHEIFIVALLDTRHRIFKDTQVAMGSLNEACVHPRELFAPVIRESAAAIVLIHNHPSGDPSPSMSDIDLTRRIQSGAAILGIRLLDHLIIGDSTYMSFADQGLLSE